MDKRDGLDTVDSSVTGEAQNASEQSDTPERKKKRFIEPSISEPIDVLKTTTIFQAPGDTGDFGP